jgi:hypothetical protein
VRHGLAAKPLPFSASRRLRCITRKTNDRVDSNCVAFTAQSIEFHNGPLTEKPREVREAIERRCEQAFLKCYG